MAGPSTTVRIPTATHELVREIADHEGISLQDVLARALEAYRRQRVLDEVNRSYAELRASPESWRDHQEELAAWDAALADGLVTEPAPRSRRQKR
jgi:hypothetical protein